MDWRDAGIVFLCKGKGDMCECSNSRGRVRNEEVRRRAEIERELASRADQRVLRWFGHGENG